MAHEHTAGHPSPDEEYRETPPGSTYEHTDANVRIIVKFLLWLAVSAVVIHLGLGVMYDALVRQATETEHAYPLAVAQEEPLPPAPRLQQFPRNELYQFRLDEQSLLERYGWMNREAGIVHIPVEEAMRLTVERGLLASRPPETTAPATAPGQMPGDASSGRTMERRRQ
ncbi:MAG: hypothetical protein A3I61_11965 [Acidobacteria bacterium RIFCSPLOWO2_02_FULL_68_18]|nr:MAG: hypothetical protein A3I61_11965 [Acidobacteria bacterium RIFCSPLOWO2_02_FULL_68_18]OFW49668.1 MAG: hypothetical protein A3G77_16530 [Acidobacteria bacterium RIFCSPLOWO2_12_FULL_68_19]